MRLICLIQFLQFSVIQLERQRRQRIVKMMWLAGADDGRAHAWLLQDPSEGDLRIRDAALRGNLCDAIHDGEIRRLIIKPMRQVIGLCARSFAVICAFALPTIV